MIAALRPVGALLLSVAILLTGNGLQGTLLPIRAQIEAFTTLEIGLLGSAYFLGFGLGCLAGPHVIRRVGHIRTFAAMASLASAVALLHALVLSPYAWWPLRAITGATLAILYMVIESWLNERTTNETRGSVLSIYTIVNLTVMTAGQMMLTLDDPAGYPLFILASVLVSLAVLPVSFTTSMAPAPLQTVTIRFRHLYRASPVGMMGSLTVGLANGAFWSLAPIFADTRMGSVTGVAIFMSVAVLAGALGQWPLGRLSDRMDRRRTIAVVCGGAAVAGIGMSLLGALLPHGEMAFVALFGLFAFPLYALSVAHMNDFVDADGFVEASGGLLLVFALGAVAGPILASGVVALVGLDWLFAYTAAIHAGMAAFTVYRMGRRAAPEAPAPFVSVPQTAPAVFALDPRSDAAAGDPPPEDPPEQAAA